MNPVSDQEIHAFSKIVEKIIKAENLASSSTVEVMFGRRYARIVHHWGGSNSSWGWVDKTNGDVRRGSWKAPDMRVPPHTNIRAKDLMQRIAWTGPCYHKIGRTKP